MALSPTVITTYFNADGSALNKGKYVPEPFLAGFAGRSPAAWYLSDAAGFARQAAPVSGDALLGQAGGANGSVQVNGTAPAFTGGGFDYSTCTLGANYGYFTNAASSIWSSSSQDWGIFSFCELPVDANWPSAARFLISFGRFSTAGYPSLVEIYFLKSGSSYNIGIKRKKTATTSDDCSILNIPAGARGVPVMIWVQYVGGVLTSYLYYPGGTLAGTAISGAKNVEDFSTASLKFGISDNNVAGAGWTPGTLTGDDLLARNHRHYAGALFNLDGYTGDLSSQRNALYTNFVSRGAFS